MLIRTMYWVKCLLAAGLLLLAPVLSAHGATPPTRPEVYFRLANPCPSTGETAGPCKGYVIDRIVPRVCGGTDEPANMQWQTLAEAKEKDKWERIGCRPGRKQVIPTNESYTEAFPLRDAPASADVQAMPLQ